MDDQLAEIPKSLQAITIEGLAEALEVSPKTVRRWIHEQGLPVLQFGGIIRISVVDAEQFLGRHRERIDPADEQTKIRPIR